MSTITLPAPAFPTLSLNAGSLTQWGVFLAGTTTPLYTPQDKDSAVSTFAFEFTRSQSIFDFPLEGDTAGQGSPFASFNKVWQPATPIVTFAVSGAFVDLLGFLAALDVACQSTNLYDVYTPDFHYFGYSIERYTYRRTANKGATMLMVDVSLKEILPITPAYTNTLINSPQSPSASPQQNNGQAQSNPITANMISDLKASSGQTVNIGASNQ